MGEEKQLGQTKKRDKKVYITDIAIEKVPYIEYKGMDEEQNKVIQRLAKLVLRLSKDRNDSNEVAITWDMCGENINKYGIAYGTVNEVDVEADTYSYHLLHSASGVVLVLLHNHPSTRTFSLDDISYMMIFQAIEYMIVVSNQGTIHYLKKEKDYSVKNAKILYNECVKQNKNAVTIEGKYVTALEFLKRCGEAGLYYR